MVTEIILNDTLIKVTNYKESQIDGLLLLSVDFKVTSEQYHDITTLLYGHTFNVKVLERELSFRGAIYQYSTSVTNLYEKGQVGVFSLSLLEVKN